MPRIVTEREKELRIRKIKARAKRLDLHIKVSVICRYLGRARAVVGTNLTDYQFIDEDETEYRLATGMGRETYVRDAHDHPRFIHTTQFPADPVRAFMESESWLARVEELYILAKAAKAARRPSNPAAQLELAESFGIQETQYPPIVEEKITMAKITTSVTGIKYRLEAYAPAGIIYPWSQFQVGDDVRFIADPKGAYSGIKHNDPTALMVVHVATNIWLGYIPRTSAKGITADLAAGKAVLGVIVSWDEPTQDLILNVETLEPSAIG